MQRKNNSHALINTSTPHASSFTGLPRWRSFTLTLVLFSALSCRDYRLAIHRHKDISSKVCHVHFLWSRDSHSAAHLQSHTHSRTSRNWFESHSFSTMTRGISTRGVKHHNMFLFVRAKEDKSQGVPDKEG